MKGKHVLIILSFALAGNMLAQQYYPLVNKIRYKKIYPYVKKNQKNNDFRMTFSIKNVKGIDSVRLRFEYQDTNHLLVIKIFKGKERIQKFMFPDDYCVGIIQPEYIGVADINNDSLPDIKILIPSCGCGLAGCSSTKMFLFQKPDHTFKMFDFYDFSDDDECDRDGDSMFEITATTYIQHKTHAYWVHNIFLYENGQLVNKSEQFGYPLWTRFLEYSSNKVAKYIPAKVVKQYRFDFPRYY